MNPESGAGPTWHIDRLAVIGVGLIGGSAAAALRRADAVREIIGCGRSAENLETAQARGLVDHVTHDPAEAVEKADVVLVSIPVEACREVFEEIREAMAPGAVLTDAGSTKQSVINAARDAFGAVPPWFVPGHPIAGTEKTGAAAAFDSLFDDRRVILTPVDDTDENAVQQVTGLWETCGARVDRMAPEHHDEVLAATSHLPHMLAYQLVSMLAGMEESREIFAYAAGGFRDFTRIASSSPAMWHDIVLANRDALLPVMQQFRDELEDLEKAVASGDSDAILACFQRAKKARDEYARAEGRHVPSGDLE